MRVIRTALIVCALMAAPALRIVHGQSLEALAEQFVAAADDERVRMAGVHVELRDTKFREQLAGRGSAALRRFDFATAEKYQLAVLWLGNHFNDDAVRAVGFVNLASVNGQRGDYAVAKRYATDALVVAERVNDLESVQVALSSLGIIQRRLGDAESALVNFERSLALAEQLKLPVNAARVVNNIGLAYADLGDMAIARDYLDRSLAMKEKLGESPDVIQDIARTLNNIALLYDQLGDYPQALDYIQRALALLEKHGAPSLSLLVANVGHIHLKMGDYERARAQLSRAMAMAEKQGNPPQIATIMYLFGQLDRHAGRFAEAESWQRRSLAIRDDIGESIPLIESLNELAGLSMATGRPADAYALASRSVSIAAAARLPGRLAGAQMAAADALSELKRDDEAVPLYQSAIDTLEVLRQQTPGGDRARQQYLGQHSGPHLGLARAHAKNGRTFDALLAIERARARTLLDVIGGGRPATRWLSAEQKQRERELTQAVVSAATELEVMQGQRKADPSERSAIEAKLTRARLDREAYTSELYKSAPDLRIARGDTPMITRDDLNALIKPNTAIVSIVLHNTYAWVYVITRDSGGPVVTVREASVNSAQLVALADEFAKQVAARDLGFTGNARKLYDLLFVETRIEPLLNGKSRIVVIPDGELWRVPFQALRTPRDTFLIEERAVAYAPSVSAMAALERRRLARPSREPYLLALGDPAIGGAVVLQSSRRSGRTLGRLPHAAREVSALGRLYGDAKSRVLVGEQATEGALRDNLGRATVLHLATHGVLDDLSPMYSHLMLAPVPGKNSDSDGRLDAWELIDQPMTIDLAVLSACETARGPVGDGEGVIGLSWSLFAAGASTAVVSQWEVDSASTTALMIAFHERLLLSGKNGSVRSDTPEALRVASMRLMRTAAYRHPFYWAGFVVVGAP